MSKTLRLLIPLFFLVGCAGNKVERNVSPDFYAKAPSKVAVLPFENESVDMLAPIELQSMVVAGVKNRGYDPLAQDAVQQKLKEIGITDGGQLRAVSPQTLKEALKVDGLFYGTLEDFAFQNMGFILRRHVKLRIKLVLASTGETLWEDVGTASKVDLTLDRNEAERRFAAGLAEKAIQNMANRPLWLMSVLAVQRLMAKLPSPRPRVIPGYPPLPPSRPPLIPPPPPGIPPPPGVPPPMPPHR